jgi:hypothetical protein
LNFSVSALIRALHETIFLCPLTSLTIIHPRIAQRKKEGPTKVVDQLPQGGPVTTFNAWLAVKITTGVGTMWCAYLFAILAFIGLPAALRPGGEGIISWIAQTFLQLVLLSIIIVGQNIAGAASDKRAEATFNDADAILHESIQIQAHLEAQDKEIERIVTLVNEQLQTIKELRAQ